MALVKRYAGIGSRQTPEEVLAQMRDFGYAYAKLGYVLRSGGADGADTAFEEGCDAASGQKEIFLPYKGFNGNSSPLYTPTPAALVLASRIHPAWHMCNHAARLLHARNCHQILGLDLQTPVERVICWSRGISGGTTTAIRLAEMHGIPVHNLFEDDRDVGQLSFFTDSGSSSRS